MGLFESQASKEKKAAVINIIAVMRADGKIMPQELVFLDEVCKRLGLPQKDLEKILKNPDKIKFTIPKNVNERFIQFIDIIGMMIVDGEIDPREMDIVINFADRLGFPPSTVKAVVTDIVNGFNNGLDLNQIVTVIQDSGLLSEL